MSDQDTKVVDLRDVPLSQITSTDSHPILQRLMPEALDVAMFNSSI